LPHNCQHCVKMQDIIRTTCPYSFFVFPVFESLSKGILYLEGYDFFLELVTFNEEYGDFKILIKVCIDVGCSAKDFKQVLGMHVGCFNFGFNFVWYFKK
jgi:hypothetical protein